MKFLQYGDSVVSLRFKYQEVGSGLRAAIESAVEEALDYDDWNDVEDGFQDLGSENPANYDALQAVENAVRHDMINGADNGRFSSHNALAKLAENLQSDTTLNSDDVSKFIDRTNAFIGESLVTDVKGSTETLLQDLGLDASADAWNNSMNELNFWYARAEGDDLDFDAVEVLIEEIKALGLDRLSPQQRDKLNILNTLREVRDVADVADSTGIELAELRSETGERLATHAKLNEIRPEAPNQPLITVASTGAELSQDLSVALASLGTTTMEQFNMSPDMLAAQLDVAATMHG